MCMVTYLLELMLIYACVARSNQPFGCDGIPFPSTVLGEKCFPAFEGYMYKTVPFSVAMQTFFMK